MANKFKRENNTGKVMNASQLEAVCKKHIAQFKYDVQWDFDPANNPMGIDSLVWEPSLSLLSFKKDKRTVYDAFDFDRATSTAHVLDILLQTTSKTWCTPELSGTLIAALHEVSYALGGNIQGKCCPFGHNVERIKWELIV